VNEFEITNFITKICYTIYCRLGTWYEEGFVMEKLPYKVVKKDIRPHIEVKTNDGSVTRQVSIDDVAAVVFAKLRETAEAYLGRKIRHAVFTLPGQHRSDAARETVKFAAARAGLRPMRILDEPIAAAIAYGLHRKLRDDGNVLVLHVGGGTAEASVLTFADDVFDFLGGGLDPYFGGEDFDRRVVDYFVQLIKVKHGKDISDGGAALGKLRSACEDAKKTLSSQEHAQVEIKSLFDGVDLSETLTRSRFEELNHDLFLKVVEMIDTVMSQAELGKGMVDEVVLIGGSTMIPKIRKIVRDYLGGKEVNTKLKPDEAVTFGAALLSHPAAHGYPCMGVDNRYQIGGPSDSCYI
jgi:endoplasmic reticulum chaperone BiP